MNPINIEYQNSFLLSQVLSIYKRQSQTYPQSPDNLGMDFYLEIQNVLKHTPDGPMLSAAQPLTEEVLQKLSSFLHTQNTLQLGGAIPRNLLYANLNAVNQCMIWYRKPQITELHFKGNPELPKKSLSIALPGLIFKVLNNQLFLYAFRGRTATKATMLYKAPLLNLNLEGRICLGTTINSIQEKLPYVTQFENYIQLWESSIFNSYFTLGEGNGDRQINANISLLTLYRLLDEKHDEAFDTAMLVPLNQSLSHLFKSYENN